MEDYFDGKRRRVKGGSGRIRTRRLVKAIARRLVKPATLKILVLILVWGTRFAWALERVRRWFTE